MFGLSGMDYPSRLPQLRLFSIRGRMFPADLMKIWEVFHSEVDVRLSSVFERQSHVSTRGHSFKLSVPIYRSELRRRFFNAGNVSTLNSLPVGIVDAGSPDSFQARLDCHMSAHFFKTLEEV